MKIWTAKGCREIGISSRPATVTIIKPAAMGKSSAIVADLAHLAPIDPATVAAFGREVDRAIEAALLGRMPRPR